MKSISSEAFFLTEFSAKSAPMRFERHLIGHASTLSEFGVEAESISKWTADRLRSSRFVQITSTKTKKVVAGICVQFRNESLELPTEKNLADPLLRQEIESRQCDNPCEICGTWISSEYRKAGLLPNLFYAAVAAAHMGGSKVNFASAHEKSAKLFRSLGVSIDYDRVFFWPDERYKTYIARINISEYVSAGTHAAKTVIEMVDAFSRGQSYQFELENDRPFASIYRHLRPAVDSCRKEYSL